MSLFSEIQSAPPVEVFKLTADYNADPAESKVSLGVGAYRDEAGKPWVLPVVKKAELVLAQETEANVINHEYFPVLGMASFSQLATQLILGKGCPAIEEGRAFGVQSLSGTGCLRVGAEFLRRQLNASVVLLSEPTWGNHNLIFKHSGYAEIKKYRYWNGAKCELDIDGMLEDLKAAPAGAVVVLHACAHNPTGIDPTKEQWKTIADVVEANKLVPFFDSAYQGFASGDLDADAWAVRYFVNDRKMEILCSQSFAKNFGLYNERPGNLVFVVNNKDVVAPVKSQLTLVARGMYSNPPAHGVRIIEKVLSSPELYQEWTENVKTMASRILNMRTELRSTLERLNTPGTWHHVTDQIGMFSFTGMTPEMVDYLVKEKHIYLLKNGRISVAGLTPSNVNYVAESMNEAVIKFKQ